MLNSDDEKPRQYHQQQEGHTDQRTQRLQPHALALPCHEGKDRQAGQKRHNRPLDQDTGTERTPEQERCRPRPRFVAIGGEQSHLGKQSAEQQDGIRLGETGFRFQYGGDGQKKGGDQTRLRPKKLPTDAPDEKHGAKGCQ